MSYLNKASVVWGLMVAMNVLLGIGTALAGVQMGAF